MQAFNVVFGIDRKKYHSRNPDPGQREPKNEQEQIKVDDTDQRTRAISHPQYDAKPNEGPDDSADPSQQHRIAHGVQQHGKENDQRPKACRDEIRRLSY